MSVWTMVKKAWPGRRAYDLQNEQGVFATVEFEQHASDDYVERAVEAIRGAPGQKAAAALYYRDAIVKLYRALGFDEGNCRSCGKHIWWVVTKNGKRAPYTVDGISHFADCPHAKKHRSK
jgi:hypothetical protein